MPSAPLSRNPLAVGLVAALLAICLAVVGLYVAGVGPFPSHSQAPAASPPSALSYSEAEAATNATAQRFSSGYWEVVLAAGLDLRSSFSVATNLSGLISDALQVNCQVAPAISASSLTVPAYSGNLTSGLSPAWVFLYVNSSGSALLIADLHDSSEVIDLVNGCGAELSEFAGVSPNATDSPEAVSTAMADGGYTFAVEHPGGNTTALAFSGTSPQYYSALGYWLISYSTCPLTSAPNSNDSYYDFSVKVSTTSLTVYGVTHNGTTTCSGPFGVPLAPSERPEVSPASVLPGPTSATTAAPYSRSLGPRLAADVHVSAESGILGAVPGAPRAFGRGGLSSRTGR